MATTRNAMISLPCLAITGAGAIGEFVKLIETVVNRFELRSPTVRAMPGANGNIELMNLLAVAHVQTSDDVHLARLRIPRRGDCSRRVRPDR